jgi:biotin transport system substrate-specific component
MKQNNKTPKSALRNRRVFIALFAALIAVSCIVSLSAGPFAVVPIVLQNMMALLAGSLQGGVGGAASVILFIIAGALGLPVFSGGKGGLAVLLGPTGGFLIGYLLGSLAVGLILRLPSPAEKKSFFRVAQTLFAGLAGFAVVYLPGLAWIAASYVAKRDNSPFLAALSTSFTEFCLPFVPGDLVKLALFTILTLALRPTAARYANPLSHDRRQA